MRDVDIETFSPNCPYCHARTVLIRLGDTHDIRPDHTKIDALVWSCAPCEAYVGCHPSSVIPLGTPAKRGLRSARRFLHAVYLDPLWRDAHRRVEFESEIRRDRFTRGIITRTVRRRVYEWLADALSLPEEENHVGHYDDELCAAARKALSKTTYEDIAEWAKPLEEARILLPAAARRHELANARTRAIPPPCPSCSAPAELIEIDQDLFLHELPVYGWICAGCGLGTDCLWGSTVPRGRLTEGTLQRARRALRGLITDMCDTAPELPYYRGIGLGSLVTRRIRQLARLRIEDWLQVAACEDTPLSQWSASLNESSLDRLSRINYETIRRWAAAVRWNTRQRAQPLLADIAMFTTTSTAE